MAQAERRVSLGELIRTAGIAPAITRQPCLPAPSQPSKLASKEDRTQARDILIRRRQKNPESKDAVLKRIFKSSKEKEKALDPVLWEFSQDELDQALSAVIRNNFWLTFTISISSFAEVFGTFGLRTCSPIQR